VQPEDDFSFWHDQEASFLISDICTEIQKKYSINSFEWKPKRESNNSRIYAIIPSYRVKKSGRKYCQKKQEKTKGSIRRKI
jgi:hypothetical protein